MPASEKSHPTLTRGEREVYLTIFVEGCRVAKFADIIKIATMVIKTTFKDSNKVEGIRSYVLKCNLYHYFLI